MRDNQLQEWIQPQHPCACYFVVRTTVAKMTCLDCTRTTASPGPLWSSCRCESVAKNKQPCTVIGAIEHQVSSIFFFFFFKEADWTLQSLSKASDTPSVFFTSLPLPHISLFFLPLCSLLYQMTKC